jgi:hypothetical protein
MLDSDEMTNCGPEEPSVQPRVERLVPGIANELKMRDDQAEIRTEWQDCARADLREIVAWIGRSPG